MLANHNIDTETNTQGRAPTPRGSQMHRADSTPERWAEYPRRSGRRRRGSSGNIYNDKVGRAPPAGAGVNDTGGI
ncbi:hypothetical protein PRIPAC_87526 [Pristionchus pacificus]|uniref:Uncharacterized protein n=1 Tax=Pristionchus pacificus TaxID=54126 RepID=A0A2A6CIQ1_PRIPA|nr:hypothetical protein PRIPAC_87526 [Pristionchus pacificus]|eukprot:PDM78082.1 hypothetical protein PRIPAC_30467 [Pristionchus pacificus]